MRLGLILGWLAILKKKNFLDILASALKICIICISFEKFFFRIFGFFFIFFIFFGLNRLSIHNQLCLALLEIMALPVVEFSRQGYKIGKVFA